MKKTVPWFLAGLILAACSLLPGAYQGVERLKTSSSASVSVGHVDKVLERTVALNMVSVSARHCLKYAQNGVVDVLACAADPSTLYYSHTDHNLRTTAGGDWQSSVMGNTAAQPASCNYIAVSADATAPAAADTVLAGEISSNGLSRAIGTYAHSNGTASYTVQKVFSATGTQASQKTGLFNASSSGTMCFENTYTSVTVNNGDTLTVTWTINI